MICKIMFKIYYSYFCFKITLLILYFVSLPAWGLVHLGGAIWFFTVKTIRRTIRVRIRINGFFLSVNYSWTGQPATVQSFVCEMTLVWVFNLQISLGLCGLDAASSVFARMQLSVSDDCLAFLTRLTKLLSFSFIMTFFWRIH